MTMYDSSFATKKSPLKPGEFRGLPRLRLRVSLSWALNLQNFHVLLSLIFPLFALLLIYRLPLLFGVKSYKINGFLKKVRGALQLFFFLGDCNTTSRGPLFGPPIKYNVFPSGEKVGA